MRFQRLTGLDFPLQCDLTYQALIMDVILYGTAQCRIVGGRITRVPWWM